MRIIGIGQVYLFRWNDVDRFESFFKINLGLSSSSGVSATINTQPVRIGPIAGGTRTFSTSGGTGSQPLTVRYKKFVLLIIVVVLLA